MDIVELDKRGGFVIADEILWVEASRNPSCCKIHLKNGVTLTAYVSPTQIRSQLQKEQTNEPT